MIDIASRRGRLFEQIRQQRSFLCVGLDPDPMRMPEGIGREPEDVRRFLIEIIQATSPYAVAFKPNFAFFEAFGPEGSYLLREVIRAIPKEHLIIGDAKRGDIGHTAQAYAHAVFREYGCDAVTVSPYLGLDAIQPFLEIADHWTIALALTSNPGSGDFQRLVLESGRPLWEEVMSACQRIGSPDQLMFVVGATHPQDFQRVRQIAPDHFLLVPGFGAQQGSLEEVTLHGFNDHCGILANVSRGILYASSRADFALEAASVARGYQKQMASLLEEAGLLA